MTLNDTQVWTIAITLGVIGLAALYLQYRLELPQMERIAWNNTLQPTGEIASNPLEIKEYQDECIQNYNGKAIFHSTTPINNKDEAYYRCQLVKPLNFIEWLRYKILNVNPIQTSSDGEYIGGSKS